MANGVRLGGYALPPSGLLRSGVEAGLPSRANDAVVDVLSKLFERFQVDARVTGYSRGPSVTCYEVALGPAVRVERVTDLSKNIAYAVKCASVRIKSSTGDKSAVGVEIPNAGRELVSLCDVLRSPTATANHHPTMVGLGKDIFGRVIVAELAKMPHLLIAGSTGSGKSIAIHGLIISILTRATPEEVQMILIDAKQVELPIYDGIPHLVTPVATPSKKAAEALGWAVGEMERRYDDLAAFGFRHVDDFNKAVRAGKLTVPLGFWRALMPFPYLLVVVDELAGLVSARGRQTEARGRQVEAALTSIARRGRIVGVHLVLATDQPGIFGKMPLLRANLPSRLVFHTSSGFYSRDLLDEQGAESLAGRGDALFLPMSASRPIRMQGSFVSEAEIRDIVMHAERGSGTGGE
jgi:DNA segregation ATPase FtsK/SpoIIIE, S-DNA-T family